MSHTLSPYNDTAMITSQSSYQPIAAWTIASKTTTLIADYKSSPVYTEEDETFGFKFTGTADGYTGNSIFLPANDESEEDSGFANYWSSTEDGTDNVWSIGMNYRGNFTSGWSSLDRTTGNFVRLVLR